MQRAWSKDISPWMMRLLPESTRENRKPKRDDMFGSKNYSTSKFYTNLEMDADSDGPASEECEGDDGRCTRYPVPFKPRYSALGGFCRFQPLVPMSSDLADGTCKDKEMDGSSADTRVRMSCGVLEYGSGGYAVSSEGSLRGCDADAYAVSESDSEEESEEVKLTEEADADANAHAEYDRETASKSKPKVNVALIDTKRRRARRVAEELLVTEKNYVDILHLIDQVFQFRVDQENRAHPMFPPETVQHMFSNVKSIYKFHKDFLLPQLEQRMAYWESNPKIGDIMKNFAPFLKMYAEYVKNFDYAMNLIVSLQNKVSRFAAIINDIQKLEECAKLSLAHHMLSPIQRLPRYELLLKDYLKNLTEENPDYEDAKRALELVSTAANHTNEAMRKIDKFQKLLEIQESIYAMTDLVSATRELIKEGRIVKISARSGDHRERHLFLFSDLLLLCSIRLIPGPLYRLRARFAMESLRVAEGDNLETANTFYVSDENKSVELYTHSAEEKAAWIEALLRTVEEIMRRKASFKTNDIKATAVIKTEEVSKCMLCEAIFSVMKRKHSCRACGIVICGKCSNQKLLFEDNRNMRVCRLCHAALTRAIDDASPSSPSSPAIGSVRLLGHHSAGPVAGGLLQVSATAPSVLSGYLLLKTQASKPWTRRWFALHVDFVLYSFKCETDGTAMTATPMPGFMVTEGTILREDDPLNAKDRPRAFKIHHSRKSYYLQATSLEEKDRWMEVLRLATKAELPSDDAPTVPELENDTRQS